MSITESEALEKLKMIRQVLDSPAKETYSPQQSSIPASIPMTASSNLSNASVPLAPSSASMEQLARIPSVDRLAEEAQAAFQKRQHRVQSKKLSSGALPTTHGSVPSQVQQPMYGGGYNPSIGTGVGQQHITHSYPRYPNLNTNQQPMQADRGKKGREYTPRQQWDDAGPRTPSGKLLPGAMWPVGGRQVY